MFEILIKSRKFGQVGIKKDLAEKFPETAYFFQKSFSVKGIATAVGDGEVHEFLHTFESTFGVVSATFGEPFCGAVAFTSYVRHLLGQRHLGPSSVA